MKPFRMPSGETIERESDESPKACIGEIDRFANVDQDSIGTCLKTE